MLHWLQTTAHFCANLPYKRKRKKISINFLHIRILVFRFARRFLFLVPSKNRLLLLAVQPPLDSSAVLSNLDVRTCPSVKRNKCSTDWRYSVVNITWSNVLHVAKTREKYCMDLGIRLLLPRQSKRQMPTLSNLRPLV